MTSASLSQVYSLISGKQGKTFKTYIVLQVHQQ